MSLCVHSRPFAISHAKYLYKTKIITSFDTFDAYLRTFHTAKLKRFTFTLHIAFVTCIINNEIYKLNTMQVIYGTTYSYWLFSLFLSVFFFVIVVCFFLFSTVLALESKKIQVSAPIPNIHTFLYTVGMDRILSAPLPAGLRQSYDGGTEVNVWSNKFSFGRFAHYTKYGYYFFEGVQKYSHIA